MQVCIVLDELGIEVEAEEDGIWPHAYSPRISDETELSRQTIHKHLREYANHPQYLEQIDQFRLMIPEILIKVFQLAAGGDMEAAKLYFNVMGMLNSLMHGSDAVHLFQWPFRALDKH